MRKKDITARIKTAYSEEAPDVLERLEHFLPEKQPEEKIRRITFRKTVLIAITAVLVSSSFLFAVSFLEKDNIPDETTDLPTESNRPPLFVATSDETDELKIDPSIDPEILPYLVIDNGFSADYIIRTDIESLYANSAVVLKAAYKDVASTVYDGTTPFPITTALVEIKSVLKGEVSGDNLNIKHYGGFVRLWDFTEKMSEERVKKYGFDDMTEEELKANYIGFEGCATPKIGKEYLIFLSYDVNTDTYFVMCDGYGIRELNENGQAWNIDSESYENIDVIEHK